MIAAGMDVARISLAHGSVEELLDRVSRVRAAADAEGRVVGVLADLPGPKVRSAPFPQGGVTLVEGEDVSVVAASDGAASDDRTIVVDHPGALDALRPGDQLAIGDGGIDLVVEAVEGDRASARVRTGGLVQGRPGVSLPEERLVLESPTSDDLSMLGAIAGSVDAVAISFVRTAEDVDVVRAALGGAGPMLVAKIETRSAVEDIERIVAASDGVMVARGDLGIRCDLEDVPHIQKRIIRLGVAYGRPVITATQMLESMVRAPTPTRAEVSDVANAVFDGTSALMLSGETAIGRDPVAAVATMARVAARADQGFDHLTWGAGLGRQQHAAVAGAAPSVRITAAISAAAWRAANDADAVAVIACTNSGATARAISRFRPRMPILAVTPTLATARQLAMAWGITPVVGQVHRSTDDITWFAVKAAVERGLAVPGDVVAVLVGSPVEEAPTTDTLRLVQVR